MRKIGNMLLMGVMVMSLTGCGGQSTENTTTAETTAQSTESTSETELSEDSKESESDQEKQSETEDDKEKKSVAFFREIAAAYGE